VIRTPVLARTGIGHFTTIPAMISRRSEAGLVTTSRRSPPGLSPGQRSFPAVIGLSRSQLRFCCQAAVARPRAPFLVTMTLPSGSITQRVRNRTVKRSELKCFWHLWLCAFFSRGRLLGSLLIPETDQSKPVSPLLEH
jgi:hypothetical protein